MTEEELNKMVTEGNPPPGYNDFVSQISKETMLFLMLNFPEVIGLFTMMYGDDAPIMMNKLYEVAPEEAKMGMMRVVSDLNLMPLFKDLPKREVPEHMKKAYDLLEREIQNHKFEDKINSPTSFSLN